MRIELTPPVQVQTLDDDDEILIVAGCALGFVGAGHPPHVLSFVDGCELMASGVAIDDHLVAIRSQDPQDLESSQDMDPRNLERSQVVKALKAATALEFRRPKPVLVPAAEASKAVDEESGEDGASDCSARDAPNASDTPETSDAPVVEISDEEELKEVETPRPKKVQLVPRVNLSKPPRKRVTLKSRSPLTREHALERLKRSMAETREQLEEAESSRDAPAAEVPLPRRPGGLRPLAVLKAALRRTEVEAAEGGDRWRMAHGDRQPEPHDRGAAPRRIPSGHWSSPHPPPSAWQPPHGHAHATPPSQYAQPPSHHPPPPQWEAQWRPAYEQHPGYRDRPRLKPNPSGGASLVVDGLDPAEHTFELLTAHFTSFGQIKDLRLSQRRNEAFVTFRAVEAAEEALMRPVLGNSSLGVRPWIPSRRGQKSPFDAADAFGHIAVVEAKTKAAVSDEAKLRDTAIETLDGIMVSAASSSPSAALQAGGRLATRAAAVSSAALPAAAEGGNMQLESGEALEKKRKRDDLENQKKELLQKYTDQLKLVMSKVNDPQTPEDHKEKLQTMLSSLQAKILDMSPQKPEPKMRRETPPPSPAYPQVPDPEVPASALDLDLPQGVEAEAEPDGEVG